MSEKIKTQKQITRLAARLKKQGKKIVTYNGSFDVLHVGHVRSLEEAKRKGDVLIVPLNSDASVRLYKGPNRPIVPEKERAEMLSALESVDYVALFDEINPKAILEKIKPDIHCNGSDWGKDCVERAVVEKHGGKIHVLRWTKNMSTTDTVRRIQEMDAKKDVRAIFLDRDGTINDNRKPYAHRKEDFIFLPGVILALQQLSQTDYKIIIVTNQSGIGRKIFTENDLQKLHQWMIKELRQKNIRIDRIYHCPHAPEKNCQCRKPKIGLFLQAVKDFEIRLDKSWFIGDDERDVIAGREANIKTVKLGFRMPKELKLEPHRYAKNLLEAVRIVMK